MRRHLFIAAALLLAGAGLSAPARAADTASVTWVQPTTWETPPKNAAGQVITPTPALRLDHNKVYRGTKADGSDLVLLIQLKPATNGYIDTAPLKPVSCYAITASADIATALESGRSAVACKTFVVTPPPDTTPVKPRPSAPASAVAK